MKRVLLPLVLIWFLPFTAAGAEISHWSFDSSVNPGQDVSGTNDCALTNGPEWTPNGFVNGSIIFDGVDDYLDCGNDSTLNFGTGNFSVSFWMKTDYIHDTYTSILYKARPNERSAGYGFLLRETGGQLKFTIGDGTIVNQTVGPQILDTDWHHVVGVRGGGRIKLYFDSQLAADRLDETGSVDNPYDFVIGMGGYGNNLGGPAASLYFRGRIDEVKVFDTALNETEINQSYNDGYSDHREPPVLTMNSPGDGEVNVSAPVFLNVTVTDADGDSVDVSFYGGSGGSPSGKENFTIIALPDTQYYSESYPQIFTNQTQWIADSKDSLNIVFVTHEGDIVNLGDSTQQWDNANASMSLLDGVVPYGLAYGNHDDDPVNGDTINYNTYFNYTRFEGYPWYGGYYNESNDNNYQLFSAGGMDFIIIHLEYYPSPSALAWADQVLSNHSGRRAIITSHSVINSDGSWRTEGLDIFNALSDNPNLFLILCGHRLGEAKRKDVVGNRTIYTILADYQGMTNGGNGYLRMMTFSPKDNKIHVRTYSPYLNQYETRSSSQFTLDYGMVDYAEIGTNYGIQSGSSTTATWAGLNNNTKYYWYATGIDSNSQTSQSEAWKFVSQLVLPPPVPGDLNGDWIVDIEDLAMIANDFGKRSGFDPRSDTIASGEIDIYDLVFVASRFTG